MLRRVENVLVGFEPAFRHVQERGQGQLALRRGMVITNRLDHVGGKGPGRQEIRSDVGMTFPEQRSLNSHRIVSLSAKLLISLVEPLAQGIQHNLPNIMEETE